MNNEDMSEIIQKLSSMLNSSDNTSTHQQNADNSNDVSSNSNQLNEETFRTILNQLNLNQSSEQNSEQSNNNFHFDITTLLKMKTVMDKMNSTKNDPRANLLYSLKPYLNQNRKEKLEQYMQILNISKIIDAFNSEGGVNQK